MRGVSRALRPPIVLALAIAFGLHPALAPLAEPAGPRRPALTVVIVVDQLPAGKLEQVRPLLRGGYARLLEEGRRFTACSHAHASTETGPGHATLLSGLHPGHSGIILNDWYDTASGEEVYCVGNPRPGAKPAFHSSRNRSVSPDNLRGESFADLLKRSNPISKVFSVSGKDRSAVLTAGHRPDGAFWYNRDTGGFTSNPSLVAALPAWGAAFWGEDPAAGALYEDNIPDEWTYPERPQARPDNHPNESALLSRAAPHPVMRVTGAARLDRRRARAAQILFSPWVDWLTLEMGRRIIDAERLGRDDATDLLVLALSGADTVGHTYGPGSQEYLDALIRVDGWLGALMRHAEEASREHGGVIFALSSDHGVLPIPETVDWARRVDSERVLERFDKALRSRLAPDANKSLIAMRHSGHLYFDRRKLAANGLKLERAIDEASRILKGFPEIERVYRRADLTGEPGGDMFLRLYRNAYDPQRGGDLIIQPCRGCLFTKSSYGTSHGSPYGYDRRVPMILMGPGIAAGTVSGECRTVDLAPTLASLLGLEFEHPRDGKALDTR